MAVCGQSSEAQTHSDPFSWETLFKLGWLEIGLKSVNSESSLGEVNYILKSLMNATFPVLNANVNLLRWLLYGC